MKTSEFKIGDFIQQAEGYKAFIPTKFPPTDDIPFDKLTNQLHAKATLLLGKLDGITQLLPDLDFFIFMYVRKEATLSSQIEGTKATMIDSIRAEAEVSGSLPDDVDDIQHYINAMNYGLKRLQDLPLSLRLIREVHKVLMKDARTTHYAAPGEFRRSQNWIGGATPTTASYVPPPVHEMKRALDDFEKFIHSDEIDLPLVKTALIHAQFETIHPFLDGNGRTGRLLITFFLCQQGILERPVLYLSEYFKKNRGTYYDLLNGYHGKGQVTPWLNFFLEGVATVASEAIETCREVTKLRVQDIQKIQSLGRSAKMGMLVLQNLYRLPIVSVKNIEEWTGLSRVNANGLVKKLVDIKILGQQDKSVEYGRVFEYKKYLSIFNPINRKKDN